MCIAKTFFGYADHKKRPVQMIEQAFFYGEYMCVESKNILTLQKIF